MHKCLRHRDAFRLLFLSLLLLLLLSFLLLFIYLTSVQRHINDKTNLKSQSLQLDYLHLIKNKISKTII